MNDSDLADIDRELEELGSVPAHLSRIVARYGGWGLELDEVDETLEAMDQIEAVAGYPASSEIAAVEAADTASSLEFQDEPEEEVVAGDPGEVFQDDIDEKIAQEIFVEAESQGLIQRASEPPEVSVSYETFNEEEPEPTEYANVLPEELTPIDQDVLDLEAPVVSDRRSFAEFVDDNGQQFVSSSDQSENVEVIDQPIVAEREFDAVYFDESEEELPATEELRAYRDREFEHPEEDATFASEAPSEERVRERNPFRDSEYKRLLELELDPSDFPQSEPPSRPPPVADTAEDAALEALDDDDIVEIADEDIEIGDDSGSVIVTVDETEGQDEIVEVVDDEFRR